MDAALVMNIDKRSDWLVRQLKKDSAISANVTSDASFKFDPRFNEAIVIFSFVCVNPAIPISELVITRHKNRRDNVPQLDGAVSILVYAKAAVAKRALEPFQKEKVYCQIAYDYVDDRCARLGLVAGTKTEKGAGQLKNILDLLNKMCPFSEVMQQQIDCLMNPEITEGKAVPGVQLDEKAEPVYFNSYRAKLTWGACYQRFHPKYDMEIVSELPKIHQDILNQDIPSIRDKLTKNPELAYQRDPFGKEAYELAVVVGPLELFKLFYAALKKIPAHSSSNFHRIRNFRVLIETWENTGLNSIIFLGDVKKALKEDRFGKSRKKYLEILAQPAPVRSELHKACLHGNTDFVKTQITANPDLIESQDPRGFTPLLLALVAGNAELTHWLIHKGANLEPVEFTFDDGVRVIYRPIEHASSPKVMEILLHYFVDPSVHDINDRLIQAIKSNDVKMVTYMLYYLHELPSECGLTALELAIKYSCRENYGTEVLSVMLEYYDKEVSHGPYDVDIKEYMLKFVDEDSAIMDVHGPYALNITPAVRDMLIAHNQRIRKYIRLKNQRPKVFGEVSVTSDGKIHEVFKYKNKNLDLVIMPMSDLTDEDKSEISRIFFYNFKMFGSDSEGQRLKYLQKSVFPTKNSSNKNYYIAMMKNADNLIAFVMFEKMLVDDKCIFYFKLAANDPGYPSMGFLTLTFRVPLAYKKNHPNEKVFIYFKSIPPGYGICTLPKNVVFFPKYHFSHSLIDKIVQLTGDALHTKTIQVRLEVLAARKPSKENFALRYYTHIVGPGTENAMAVCMEVNDQAIQSYLQELEYYDITQQELTIFARAWDCFATTNLSHFIH